MIDELRLLLQVIEAGSLSKAAINQGLAVSSVTRKIDRLEEEMGTKLLLRNSRSLKLTDAGEQFIATARNIVAEMDEAKASLLDLQSDPRGLLTVTAPSAFGRRHVLPAVTKFLKLYPHIEIDLHLDDHLVDLAEHRVDVAIRIGLLPDSDLIATHLAPSVRVACASPDYIKARGAPSRPEELLQHNCLSVASRPLPACWWCFAGVNREAALPIKGNFRANDTEALLGAAIEGVGIVHLATWLVSDKINSGELVQLLSDFVLPSSRGIHAVRLPGRSHNLKAKLFIDHLKQSFGAPTYWDQALQSTK